MMWDSPVAYLEGEVQMDLQNQLGFTFNDALSSKKNHIYIVALSILFQTIIFDHSNSFFSKIVFLTLIFILDEFISLGDRW